ncbi:TPA: 4Fe-4S cluster-binding domain-containing protein, partial [Candidatus Poribacteria bacterium]|nr:4Fe-4S cluster-binding domain-containing protein [Candidatus Poribacteria bacterium]
GEAKECRIVFFGGEPLMNFDLVKHVVAYSRENARKQGKRVKFNMTTNGTLLSDEIINYLNEESIGVLISIDGTKEIQDKQRPHISDGIIFLPNTKDCALTKKLIEFHGRVYANLHENDREVLDVLCNQIISMYRRGEAHKIGI